MREILKKHLTILYIQDNILSTTVKRRVVYTNFIESSWLVEKNKGR